MEAIAAIGALVVVVIGVLVKISRVFRHEWSLATKILQYTGKAVMPFCLGIGFGYNFAGSWKSYAIYGFGAAGIGLVIWVFGELFQIIDTYTVRSLQAEKKSKQD